MVGFSLREEARIESFYHQRYMKRGMKSIKAVYDGKRVKLLEPVDLPPNTPLDIIVKKKPTGRKRNQDSWDSLGDNAIDLGVGDLAEQHDHYLYGVPKRRRNP